MEIVAALAVEIGRHPSVGDVLMYVHEHIPQDISMNPHDMALVRAGYESAGLFDTPWADFERVASEQRALHESQEGAWVLEDEAGGTPTNISFDNHS